MTQTIIVRIKDVYGTQTVYPVCELAIGLAALAGTKTLTPAALTANCGACRACLCGRMARRP